MHKDIENGEEMNWIVPPNVGLELTEGPEGKEI